ncbi:hypothetical protein [Sphingomonas rubra]|uniref:hypothetical protein n=1 Tax=Sphingomonas rubra TaxID=634430 RepID=UPI000B84112A|nr:hypothetical protein [Sphingomonas rubra]
MTSDIARLRSLRATLDEMLRPGFGEGDEASIEAARLEIGRIEADWPDTRLRDAHRQSDDQDAAVERDAIAAEIQRRGIEAR